MSRSDISPLPPSASMACSGTALLFTLLLDMWRGREFIAPSSRRLTWDVLSQGVRVITQELITHPRGSQNVTACAFPCFMNFTSLTSE
jgi:hypothetical protein